MDNIVRLRPRWVSVFKGPAGNQGSQARTIHAKDTRIFNTNTPNKSFLKPLPTGLFVDIFTCLFQIFISVPAGSLKQSLCGGRGPGGIQGTEVDVSFEQKNNFKYTL